MSRNLFPYPYPVHEAIEFFSGEDSMLVYHGHQFSRILQKFEKLCSYGLHYVAYPLGIMNYSKSPDIRKKMKTEIRAYEASRNSGILSIIGHTHRPLFESLSKRDAIKYRIDTLIRLYRDAQHLEKQAIVRQIRSLQKTLWEMKDHKELHISELYSAESLVPCLFNSGCGIGKRSMTCLEINQNEIQLVYWYNQEKSPSSEDLSRYDHYEIPGSPLRKIVLNRENLHFIQDKIRLMTPQPSLSSPGMPLPFSAAS